MRPALEFGASVAVLAGLATAVVLGKWVGLLIAFAALVVLWLPEIAKILRKLRQRVTRWYLTR